jgi:hypothetical protein
MMPRVMLPASNLNVRQLFVAAFVVLFVFQCCHIHFQAALACPSPLN